MSCEESYQKMSNTEKYTAGPDATNGLDSPSSTSTFPSDEVRSEEPADLEQPRIRTIRGVKWFLFNFTTLTSVFLYALDNTIVSNIQPAIVNTFSAVPQLPWLSVGFMVGGLALVMPLGKFYGMYPAKTVYLISTIIFMAASALCGAAPTMTAEIVGRVFAGAGGNGMYFGLLNLISTNTEDAERPFYLSLTGTVWGLGTVLGPVLGGAFALTSWRWGFYINLFFAIFLLPASWYLIPSTEPVIGGKQSFIERARSFDWLGCLLSISGFVLPVVAINFGGTLWAWESAASISIFVISGVVWVAFLLQQVFCIRTTSHNRLLPLHLFKKREVILIFTIGYQVGVISYTSVYYIPLFFQFTRGDSAILTAARMLPFIMFLIALMLSSGYLMGKWGYYKPWYLCGSALALIGSALMSTIDANTTAAANYGYQIVLACGAGAFTQIGFAVVQAVVPVADAGNGVTVMLIAQLSGLSFGLSVAGAIFINLSENGLARVLPQLPRSDIQQAIAGTSGAVLAALSDAERERALDVIVHAQSRVFIMVLASAAVSFVLSVFLSNKRSFIPVAAAGA